MKNRIIQLLVEYNNAVFWQTKDQTMAIEKTPPYFKFRRNN